MLFLIILLASCLLRLQRFDFPASYTFAWGDGTRDFLVGSHILKYHEFPLVGPFNLLNDAGIYNSPIYFYILSLFLIPLNNILTLSLINIFLQLGVIVLIYKITKKIFDYPTALIATLLFSFNPEVIKQADFVWQPYLALPFALLGLYFNASRPYISLSLILFAVSLHNSIFPWVPLFLFRQRSIKALFITFSSLLLYLPVLFFYQKNGFPNPFQDFPIIVNSLTNYFSNLGLNVQQLLNAFYLNNILAFFLLIGFFITLKQDSNSRKSFIFFLLLFISPIIFASFFNKMRLHYLILSVASLPIIVARITGIFRPFLRIIIVLLLILIFSGYLSYFRIEAKNPLDNQKKVDQMTLTVLEELSRIKKTEGFSNLDFFQVASFAVSEVAIPYPVLDTFLIVPLEERLRVKLAQISDQSPYNHFQINRKEYLLVSCFELVKKSKDCLGVFKYNFPDYNILKMIYNDESVNIYLAKHEQI